MSDEQVSLFKAGLYRLIQNHNEVDEIYVACEVLKDTINHALSEQTDAQIFKSVISQVIAFIRK